MRTVARLFSVLTAVLVGAAGLAVVPTPAAAAESRAVCNYDWVRVRSAASPASRELGRLPRGTVVTGDRQGTWFRLTDGRFVAAHYTCSAPAPAAPPAPAAAPAAQGGAFQVCRTASVRVRERATTGSRELRRLARGTTMVGSLEGRWLRLADGSGHVAAYYACTAAGEAPAAAPTPAREAARTDPAPLGATPLLQPTGTLGSPTSPFGQRFHPILRTWRIHNGIDIGNRAGEPVLAAESGVVTTVGSDASAGLHLKIDHGPVAGTARVGTGYLHLASSAVSRGQRVERGQVIGYVGNTGLSTKPHLHFIVYADGRPVNPEPFIGALSSLRA